MRLWATQLEQSCTSILMGSVGLFPAAGTFDDFVDRKQQTSGKRFVAVHLLRIVERLLQLPQAVGVVLQRFHAEVLVVVELADFGKRDG
jgi:uncharacterized RDD family membrane protein YckC